ncbi:MAG TPA: amidohydrolase family protein [Bryobacteraceae bacterium]|nr:amidohydrolase family protein [Bryobacteraceae bacterium]
MLLLLLAITGTFVLAQQPVIDAHVHADFGDRTPAQLLADWKQAGVVGAVFHTSRDGSGRKPPEQPKNSITCLGVADSVDLAAIESGLKAKQYGCVKIYLGYVYRYASDPAYTPIYHLAAKYDVPVVFHTGDTITQDGKVKYAHPLTIDEVAVDHRKTTFVLAHCGNPWTQDAAEVAYKNPNVYLECSALLLGDLSRMAPDKVNKYVVEPISWVFGYLEDPRKLLFGSDWPASDLKSYLEAYKRAIPREHWQLVFHDNAARVFRLEKPRP